MEEEVEEEYKAAATVDSRRACPSGCPRAVRGGVTATRRQAALGIDYHNSDHAVDRLSAPEFQRLIRYDSP